MKIIFQSLMAVLIACSITTTQALAGDCAIPGDVICNANCTGFEICQGTAVAGEYEKIDLETCPIGTTCYAPTLECSEKLSSCPPPREFECTSTSAFPDPFDCTKYYLCLDGVRQDKLCSGDWAYNAMKKACSDKVGEATTRQCQISPIPVCTAIGQTGATCEDNSIYYVCKRDGMFLYPVLYACPNSLSYDEDNFRCSIGKASNLVNGCNP